MRLGKYKDAIDKINNMVEIEIIKLPGNKRFYPRQGLYSIVLDFARDDKELFLPELTELFNYAFKNPRGSKWKKLMN